jgi:hypothetical protein
MSTSSETADIPVRRKKWLPIGLVFAVPAIVLLKMGFFFLLIGMLPTLLAVALARESRPYIVSTVAAFNFAGVFPDMLSVALQGGQPRAVLDKLSDITVWGSMYGAALLGWAIVWLSPGIAMVILEGLYKGRMRHMENMQKKLEDEWGKQIAGREK